MKSSTTEEDSRWITFCLWCKSHEYPHSLNFDEQAFAGRRSVLSSSSQPCIQTRALIDLVSDVAHHNKRAQKLRKSLEAQKRWSIQPVNPKIRTLNGDLDKQAQSKATTDALSEGPHGMQDKSETVFVQNNRDEKKPSERSSQSQTKPSGVESVSKHEDEATEHTGNKQVTIAQDLPSSHAVSLTMSKGDIGLKDKDLKCEENESPTLSEQAGPTGEIKEKDGVAHSIESRDPDSNDLPSEDSNKTLTESRGSEYNKDGSGSSSTRGKQRQKGITSHEEDFFKLMFTHAEEKFKQSGELQWPLSYQSCMPSWNSMQRKFTQRVHTLWSVSGTWWSWSKSVLVN